jgi:hypothetical protein
MYCIATLLCTLALCGCQFDFVGLRAEASPQNQTAPTARVVIDTTSLPGTYRRSVYSQRLQAHGGSLPYHWRVEKGELPPGVKLEDDGTLHGSPEAIGEFRFTISVTDNSLPPQAVQRDYVLTVVADLIMRWKMPPHVVGNRIEGSVEVSNNTLDDFDFTFYVLAVNEIGRATAIGYQHFPLKTGTADFELPFGETLPHGPYIVHADAVGEVPDKNQIHRARLQTPTPLQVTVGP